MMKFGKLFNAYGNDQIAIVNPANRPDMIQIKNRTQIKERVFKQMGLTD